MFILVFTCWPLIYISSHRNTVTLPHSYSFWGLYFIHCIPFWCLFSSWNFFMTHHISVVCLPNRIWWCPMLHYLTGYNSVMSCSAPLLGSVCESSTQDFLHSVLKRQELSMCLLESLDWKYVLFNEWRIEVVNGIYLFWNYKLCTHDTIYVKNSFSWCNVTKKPIE